MGKAIMIQGTASDVGKSIIVTGLCRLFKRRGLSVSPFKPKNISLNSAVTADGGEIGRAQAVQAQAAGISPHSDMNPILLKPSSDTHMQVIVNGKVATLEHPNNYDCIDKEVNTTLIASFERLCEEHDVVVVEGSGSPVEVNLWQNDVGNMGFAEMVNCPVILVATVECGGVFAQIVGTLELLTQPQRRRIVGFIINKFHGNKKWFDSGVEWIQKRTGRPVFGVLPFMHDLHIEAEDSVSHRTVSETSCPTSTTISNASLRILVPMFPHMSNHTDLDPLFLHPQTDVQFVRDSRMATGCDVIFLPGSKNVRADLDWLRDQGWERIIKKHLRYGGKVIGICGGYQMLGHYIHDPDGLEDQSGSTNGLGLLDIETQIRNQKTLRNDVSGNLILGAGQASFHGYEIHMGITYGKGLSRPLLQMDTVIASNTIQVQVQQSTVSKTSESLRVPITNNNNNNNNNNNTDGAISEDDQVCGTYVHGLFEDPKALDLFLEWAGLPLAVMGNQKAAASQNYDSIKEENIERLASMLEDNLDIDSLIDSFY